MKFLIVLFVLVSPALTQNPSWSSLARFSNFSSYFPNLMQETVYEMEKHGWWNFRLNDIDVTINERIYDRHFIGYANYSDGFLVSIQKLELTSTGQSFSSTEGSMRGRLVLHHVTVGYNVFANFTELGTHRFTGTYLINSISFDIRVAKNMHTNEITTEARLVDLASGGINHLMVYMPESDISEVLSRSQHFRIGDSWDGVALWGSTIIAPAIKNVITNTLALPDVCFNHC